MNLQLKGKTALVTGSTAGIGEAIARQLAAEGVHVYVNGRTRERVASVTAEIIRIHPGASLSPFVCDFSKPATLEEALNALDPVDILINNVGIFEPRPFVEISDQEWYKMIEVNLMSGVRLSRHLLPAMLQRGWGRILFISSESGVQIPEEMIHYGVSKTAQIALANGIARLTKDSGVTVNSVLPGSTWSEGAAQFIADLASKQKKEQDDVIADFFREVRPNCLLQRFATTDEVANMVTFLASPLSSATNGASIRVDGGTLPTIL